MSVLLALLLAAPVPNAKVGGSFSGDLNGGTFQDFVLAHESVTAGVGSPNVLTTAECGKTIDDIGASALTYNTLPDAPTAGCFFKFVVTTANGIRVTANSGDTVSMGALTSGAAGYVQSTVPRSVAVCEAASATSWTCDISGDWSVDGTRYHYVGGNKYYSVLTLSADGTGADCAIVGSNANQLNHAAGCTVAPAPGAGKMAVFERYAIRYLYSTDTYGGGGSLEVRYVTCLAQLNTGPAASSTFGATAHRSNLGVSVNLNNTSSGDTCGTNEAIFVKSSAAYTQPGTAAGTGTIITYYSVIPSP
jgi:hypothetical protein